MATDDRYEAVRAVQACERVCGTPTPSVQLTCLLERLRPATTIIVLPDLLADKADALNGASNQLDHGNIGLCLTPAEIPEALR